MKISTLALSITAAVLAQQAFADDFGLGSLGTGTGHSGFLEDSHASVSSRTMYYSADNRSGTNNDLRETATALRFDYKSGFTQGTVGLGFDVMAFGALRLDGGDGHTAGAGLAGNGNSFFPTKNNGTEPADSFGRAAGNVKFRISQTELHVGGGLAPVLPILVSNDSRVAPQTFDGGILTSNDIPNVTFTGGELNRAEGRASSNSTGLSVAGGTRDSDSFKFGGVDYKPFGSSDNVIAKNLTLQTTTPNCRTSTNRTTSAWFTYCRWVTTSRSRPTCATSTAAAMARMAKAATSSTTTAATPSTPTKWTTKPTVRRLPTSWAAAA